MAIDQHFQNMFDAAAYNTPAWNDSGVAGYGTKLKLNQRQFGLLIATDENGTALGTGWYSAIFGQDLVTAYTSSSNVSRFGVSGELHLGCDATTGGNLAGVYAYSEVQTTFTVSNNGDATFCALLAGLDIPSGAIIASGSMAACIAVGGNFGGTHTGKLAAFHVMDPPAGSYDYLFQIGDGRNADGTGISTTIAGTLNIQTIGLKVRVGATTGYIVVQTGTGL